jgi:8-oxo-dGTP pyrophosphatase MutT (NUDIX family)
MQTINPNTLNGIDQEYIPEKPLSEYEPRLTARVFVIDSENNIGLIRHPPSNMLFPPGGGAEKGETVFEASTREVAEELGVVCTPVEDLGILEHYHDKWMKKFIIHHVYATTDKQSIEVDLVDYDTNLERVWVSIEEYRNILDNYLKNEKPDDVWAKAILYFLDAFSSHK